MRDLDPQLMRLREVEAKIVLLAMRLAEAEELVQALYREAVVRPVDEQHRRLILQSLETLRGHREAILAHMQAAPARGSVPLPSTADL